MTEIEATLRRIIREEFESLMDRAYAHGYNAGRRETTRSDIDRDSYRRGYHSGYHAASTGTPRSSDPMPQRRRRVRA